MTPHCDHFKEHGEGVEWPIEISLEHFDDCLAPEQRLQRWEHARDMANRAIRCSMADHEGAVEHIRELQRTVDAFVRVGHEKGTQEDIDRVVSVAGLDGDDS